MEKYIENLKNELCKNKRSKTIVHHIEQYQTIDISKLLNDLGYGNKRVEEYFKKSKAIKPMLKATKEHQIKILEEIRNNLLKMAISKNKEIIYILGLPGAGKTTAIPQITKKYGNNKFYIVDPDVLKFGKQTKEEIISPLVKKELKGLDAQAVHEASSRLSKLVIEYIVEGNYNLVVPKVGEHLEELRKSIKKLNNRGYKVYLHFIFTTIKTALQRNLERFIKATEENKEIRILPGRYIYQLGYKPLFNFLELAKDNTCQDYELWNGEHKGNDSNKILLNKNDIMKIVKEDYYEKQSKAKRSKKNC